MSTLTLATGTEGVAVNATVGVNVIVGGSVGVIVWSGVGNAALGRLSPLASRVCATLVATELLLAGISGVGVGLLKVHARMTSNAVLIINKFFFFTASLLFFAIRLEGVLMF